MNTDAFHRVPRVCDILRNSGFPNKGTRQQNISRFTWQKKASNAYHQLSSTLNASKATICQQWWECPEVSKFEQASSDGHQLLLVKEGGGVLVQWGLGVGWGGGVLDRMPVNRMTNWQTDTTENITFPKICWRAPKITMLLLCLM